MGESAGRDEALIGEPFVGAAGGVLSRICQRAGIDRKHTRIANVVSCEPPGDYLVGAPWEEQAVSQCRQYLQPVLAGVPDGGVVVPLGASALASILNLRGAEGIRVQDFHGTVSQVANADKHYWVVPSYHPSHLQRGAMNLLEVVTQDFRLADRISQHGFQRSPSKLVVDPHPSWLSDWVNAHLARVAADPEGVHLAIDTEYAEKAGGADESEIDVAAGSRSPITRVNGGNDSLTGWTVPYRSPYREYIDWLIVNTQQVGGWIWAWNKRADLDHLQAAGHVIRDECWVDGMWCLAKETQVPTWDGKTYTIGEIVDERLDVLLIGMEHDGERIPVRISEYHKTKVRGQKWLSIRTRVRRPPVYCTPDHRIWTQDGWKEAGAVVVGDRIPTSQIGSDDLIHGTILGDGHVTRRGDLTMTHGKPQRVWLMAKCWNLGTTPFDRSRGWVQGATPIGLDWRRKFYDAKGVKHFIPPPSNAALAVWYCDDGNYHRNKGARGIGRVRIACDSFMEDRDFIVSWFRARFGAHVRFHGRKRPILVLSRDSARRFFDAVAPYVHSSMDYKLHEGWRHLYNGWLERRVPRWGEVISVKPSIVPKGSARYCVTVNHPLHRFFTVGGLVSNCWHYLQSDLPRGLGFVASMASDFGAWKHWAKIKEKEGDYAAADGLQTWRTCMWLLRAACANGVWDLFLRDWHERDVYVLRPAHLEGTPVNRVELEQFHQSLQAKLAKVLARMKETAAEGVLKPKLGYAKRPRHKKPKSLIACEKAKHDTYWVEEYITGGRGVQFGCRTCGEGMGYSGDPQPPASILGKPKKGGGEAKSAYMLEGVRLVEREVDVEVRVCDTCGAEDVSPKHKCPKANKTSRPRKSTGQHHQVAVAALPGPTGGDHQDYSVQSADPPAAALRTVTRPRTRYFWQLPFNPDAPQQILAYLAQQGIEAPEDRKRKKKTTNKKALGDLAKQHRDNPFFQLQLDWKAITKVDSTYAVGCLHLLDRDDRVHPEFLPIPSTFRDSAKGPNIQQVVADKAGPDGLASGFRRCVQARDGIPANRTEAELESWRQRWG